MVVGDVCFGDTVRFVSFSKREGLKVLEGVVRRIDREANGTRRFGVSSHDNKHYWIVSEGPMAARIFDEWEAVKW